MKFDQLFPEVPLTAKGWKYASDVVSGEIVTGKWIKAACQRALDDFEQQNTEGFPFIFNPEKAERACDFMEMIPLTKGLWASRNETLKLAPWQAFMFSELFGWVDEEGFRRFKTLYLSLGRKGGKTILAAAIGIYCLTADGEEGPEIYTLARGREQAKICFQMCRRMCKKAPLLPRELGLDVRTHEILAPGSGGILKPLASIADSLDGLSPSLAILDEVHSYRNTEIIDVMSTAVGARAQPLMLMITTAGKDSSGVAFQQESYLRQVLNSTLHQHQGLGYKISGKSSKDDSLFGLVYALDDGDDWQDEIIWVKANPLLGVSPSLETLRRACTKAKTLPSARNSFRMKHLNEWIGGDSAFFDMQKWRELGDPSLDIADFETDSVVVGLDLASRLDITALVRVFVRMQDGQEHFYLFPEFYLPENTITESPNQNYSGWVETGLLTGTVGSMTDYDVIEEQIFEDAADYDVRGIAIDPWNSVQISGHLEKQRIDVIEVPQTVRELSPTLKNMEALIADKRIHHTGHPVLSWMVSNVQAHEDRKGNIFPAKARNEDKIDGVSATLNALFVWERLDFSAKPKKPRITILEG